MMTIRFAKVAAGAAVLALTVAAPSRVLAGMETYNIDKEHTSIGFKIRHFISKVPGQFNTFEGTITLDPEDLTKGSVSVTIDAASIDTNEPARDRHLRSDAFFDVESHPEITFVSRSIRKTGEDELAIEGDLTIRGITRRVTLDVEALGFGEIYGVKRTAFEARTTIDRQDYNVSWNDFVEGGGAILGDEVQIVINLEAKLTKEKPAGD